MRIMRFSVVVAGLWLALANPAIGFDLVEGQRIYSSMCASCHGSIGTDPMSALYPSVQGGLALSKPREVLRASLREGKGLMPGYRASLKDWQIDSVLEYLRVQPVVIAPKGFAFPDAYRAPKPRQVASPLDRTPDDD